MPYVAPLYVWGVGVVVMLNIFSAANLMGHLERKHPKAWEEMGSPTFSVYLDRYSNYRAFCGQLRLAKAVLLGSEGVMPKDSATQARLWLLRFLNILSLVLMVGHWMTLGK